MDRDKENQEQLDLFYGVDRPKAEREYLESHYQSYKSEDPPPSSSQNYPTNETWTQKIERERRDGRNSSPGRLSPRGGGSKFGLAFLLLVFFGMGVMYSQQAVAGVVVTHTTGTTQNFLLDWLSLLVKVFFPISAIVLLISILARAFWKGTVGVIAIGILSFIGTGIYLAVSGIFFGK